MPLRVQQGASNISTAFLLCTETADVHALSLAQCTQSAAKEKSSTPSDQRKKCCAARGHTYAQVDMCSLEEVDEMARMPNSIPISCSEPPLNLDGLLERIWDMMALVSQGKGWE